MKLLVGLDKAFVEHHIGIENCEQACYFEDLFGEVLDLWVVSLATLAKAAGEESQQVRRKPSLAVPFCAA